MASNIYTRYTINGPVRFQRTGTQGRKPSGLGKPKLVRLKNSDEARMVELKEKFGFYWNENEFMRNAVSAYIDVYIQNCSTQ